MVARLRRIAGEKSIGHLGTLDPMATGVLPLLMGKYTRLAQFFSTAEKTYEGTIRFGAATDTYDAEGELQGPDRSEEAAAALTLERVREAAARFQGEVEQRPPAFSAKKIAGTPAYKLAREGKVPELKAVKIRIASLEVIALDGAEASFRMSIGAGGYVRSVAHELGCELKFGAHLTRLRRTQAGPFTLGGGAHDGGTGAAGRKCRGAGRNVRASAGVTAGDAGGDRRSGGAGAAAQWRAGELAGVHGGAEVKVFADQRDLVAIAKRVAGTLFQPTVVMR